MLAAKLLFIWKYIGFKTIDLSLKFGIYNYREEPDRYHPKINSPICIRCTSWESIIHDYGISVTWHVINLHFRYCYKMFLKCIQRECNYNNGYFSIESDIDYFNAPTYFIEKKSDVINIYSY